MRVAGKRKEAPRAPLAVAGVLLALLALVSLLLTVLPQSGLYATFAVESGSMSPSIETGSLVVVIPVDPASLRTGDVITYTSAQPPYPTITHRVVAIQDSPTGLLFRTKGDSNLLADPWEVRYAGKAGKAAFAIPLLGYALAEATAGPAKAVLAMMLGAALVWVWLSLVWSRRGRKK